MPKPISSSNLGTPADIQAERAICCWPGCSVRLPDHWPICTYHEDRVWQAREVDAIREHAALISSVGEKQSAAHHSHVVEVAADRDSRGHVYFIQFRDRVKIGFSTNPSQRLKVHPHETVLAIMPGTLLNERQCHAAFAHLREQGEWFRIEPDLLAFIAGITAQAS